MKNKGEEHANYHFLPENSVLKAIINRLLSLNKDQIDLSLLKILSNLDSRPLPPLDWRFLKFYQNNEKFIAILAKQCAHSYSAKAILEEKFESSHQEVALDLMLHSNKMIQSIPFGILEPFVEESILIWLHSSKKENNVQGFKRILSNYVKVINEDEVEEEIKNSLVKAIFRVLNEIIEMNGDVQDIFIEQIVDLPEEVLEKLADPFQDEEIQPNKLLLILKIRKFMTFKLKNPSLRALNMIIDHLAKVETGISFVNIKDVLNASFKIANKSDKKMMKQWLLELMGQIQFLLRNDCSVYTFNFMFEIFVLSISSMSGNNDPNADIQTLPYVMFHFLAKDKYMDIGPHLSEWLLELINKKNTKISKIHQNIIQKTWIAIKTCEGYLETSIWGRLTMELF